MNAFAQNRFINLISTMTKASAQVLFLTLST